MWWLWLVACGTTTETPEPVQAEAEQPWAPTGEATFVGSQTCAGCHEAETAAWTGSQHQRALLPAHEAPGVDLSATLTHAGGTDRFEPGPPPRFVGPDGEGEVAFWIGVDPIAQALVKADGGRLQTLDTTWDARSAADGGQRWLRLHEGLPATDALHWTARSFTANHQCLDCHTTGFDKGYRAANDTYQTTWAETGVGCEGCHGPASHHVQWAQAGAEGDPHLSRAYTARPAFDQPGDDGILRTASSTRSDEADTCARCHSRRSTLASGTTAATPLFDSHRPVWLEEPLYWPDGQIRDEVYVWGSFQQSAMHQAGVTCSNCHDPHTAELRGTPQQVCAQCHEPAVFDGVAHHHHADGAVQCVDCHMPQTTYMAVDARADHSLRVPRPDLAVRTGAPDACSSCHQEGPAWAAEAVARWYPQGQHTQGHWQEVMALGGLQEVLGVAFDPAAPDIVRATILGRTPQIVFNPGPFARLKDDPSPMVRLSILRNLDTLAPDRRPALAQGMLTDEVAAVRMEAARVLAGTSAMNAPGWARARAEYVASQALHADRAEGNVALAMFAMAEGDGPGALASLQRAIEVDPDAPMGWVNLADAWRAMGDEARAQQTLMDGLTHPALSRDGTLKHAMGLSLVRQGKHEAALVWLRESSELAPDNGRFAYVYAVALDSQGQKAEAKQVLQEAVARLPGDPQLQQALASLGQ